MTVTTATKGFLENDFLTEPFMGGTAEASLGVQFLAIIKDEEDALGVQFTSSAPVKNNVGVQFQGLIADTNKPVATEFKADTLSHRICGGFLETDFLESPFLTERLCASLGVQAEFNIVDFKKELGLQTEFNIKDKLNNVGVQALLKIVDFEKHLGVQFNAQKITALGLQTLATIYNTTNLRILCDFPSRGTPAQGGLNWTANSTEPGDFSVNNLNSDLVEKVWRSQTGTLTGIRLDNDTGLPQGVFNDTIAILNHNLSKSANLTVLGSNDPTFSTIGVTIKPIVRPNNIYWIADDLPKQGFRYWRFEIDDPTNPDGFVRIGTIVFGAAQIFQGECIVNPITVQRRDFSDRVQTEGFSNVSNSRAQRKVVRLDFRQLNFGKRNFQILSDLFETARTVLKCLYIPTPHTTNAEFMARFAAFGKLTEVPQETHNAIDADNDYVDLTIEIDESL